MHLKYTDIFYYIHYNYIKIDQWRDGDGKRASVTKELILRKIFEIKYIS